MINRSILNKFFLLCSLILFFFIGSNIVLADSGKLYDIVASKTKGSDVDNGINYKTQVYNNFMQYVANYSYNDSFMSDNFVIYATGYELLSNGKFKLIGMNYCKIGWTCSNVKDSVKVYVTFSRYNSNINYENGAKAYVNTNKNKEFDQVFLLTSAWSGTTEKLYYAVVKAGRTATIENDDGVFTLDSTKNYSYPVYFYRGNMNDTNNVIFGNTCWQIIRTTDTGGTKLMYKGSVSLDNKCLSESSFSIRNSIRNTYMYSSTFDSNTKFFHDIDSSSELKKFVESKYRELLINYDNMIEDTPFCVDLTAYTGSGCSGNPIESTSRTFTFFGSYCRVLNGTPTLTCPDSRDELTVANGKLNNKVGLITADELMYAGLTYYGVPSRFLPFDFNESIEKLITMSPTRDLKYSVNVKFDNTPNATFMNQYSLNRTYDFDRDLGYIENDPTLLNAKPVISLVNDAEVVSGSGTKQDPYVIYAAPSVGLSDLKINGTTIEGFDTGALAYSIKSKTDVTISVTTINEDATVTGTGTYSPGDTATITVTDTDGTVTTYTVTIGEYDRDNNLKSLSVTGATLSPAFGPNETSYTAKVANNQTTATINAEANSTLATLVGTGEKNLSVGDNYYTVAVTSEYGETKTYTVNIRRMMNVATLKSLTISSGTLTPSFSSGTTSYTAEVAYQVRNIDVNALVTDNTNATVTGIGTKSLNVGANTITVTVTSEDGTVTNPYTIVVTRADADIDSTLKSLSVTGATLNPSFTPGTTSYRVDLDNSVTEATINAEANSTKADLTGTGLKSNLNVGDNIFTITVTAESGDQTPYTVNLHRKSDDATLSSLSVEGFTLKETFNSNDETYHVTVDRTTTSINIIATANNEFATIVGAGTKTLIAGEEKTFDIEVTSENGNKKTYHLIASSKSKINTLDNLTVDDYTLTPVFDGSKNYTVEVKGDTESIKINATKTDPLSTVVGDGVRTLNINDATADLNVVVTSESGVDNTYTIHVIRLSNDVGVSALSVDNYDIGFETNKKLYRLTVENDVESIYVRATSTSNKATFTGLGNHALNIGDNTIDVVIKAEDGTEDTYTILVRRKSNDATLKGLQVEGHSISPTFNKGIIAYTLTVKNEVEKVNIIATSTSSAATIVGDGERDLNVGLNPLEVVVTAEDGTVITYTITVKRKSNDLSLKTLNVDVCTLTPTLTAGEKNYTCTVGYDVENATIYATLNNEDATLTGHGAKTLSYGENDFALTASIDEHEEIYHVIIRRGAKGLKNIKIDNKNGSNYNTEDNTFAYTIKGHKISFLFELYNSLQSITSSDITLTQTDYDNLIYEGEAELALGENELKIVVSQYGEDEEYTFNITREKSQNSNLKTLSYRLGYFTEDFEKNKDEYTWKVNNKLEVVNKESLIYVAEDEFATISINDSVNFDTVNDFVILVTAEDEVHTSEYTIHVVHDENSDATLKTLTINKGILIPELTNRVFVYNANLYVDEENVTITAEPNMDNATVIGDGLVTLTGETLEHEITVTAFDGSTEIYTVNINRNILRDSHLNNISLTGLDGINCTGLCGLNPIYSQNITEYNIEVPYEYNNLRLAVEKANEQQTVKYISEEVEFTTKDLIVGNNQVKIEVYDGLNVKVNEYTLNIERLKSDNNYLTGININNIPIEDFNKETLEYDLEVKENISSLNIEAIKEDSKATVTITGNNLNDFKNDIIISVRSDLGNTREYKLHVFKYPSPNNLLKSITVTGSQEYDLSPVFEKGIFSYTLIVDSVDKDVTISAEADDPGSVVTGTGEKHLRAGFNRVTIDVLNEGETRSYNILIIRYGDDNVYLKKLAVNNGSLDKEFVKTDTNYTVNINNSISSLDLEAEAESDDSIVRIFGNNNFKTGNNTVSIIVSSYDSSKELIYTINVVKTGSTDNSLAEIKADGTLIEGFDPLIKEYDIEVATNKTNINISAKTTDPLATVTGIGKHALTMGENTITLTVTAESGDVDYYYVNVFRSFNLRLASILSDKGELVPDFDPEVHNYRIELADTDKKIMFIATAESNKVNVTGTGLYNLNPGENTFNFRVFDDYDHENVYTVVVNRAQDDNNYIKELHVSGFMYPAYEKETQEYTVDLRKWYDQLYIKDIILDSDTSSYEVIDNTSLGGIDETKDIIIRVTSQAGNTRDYTLHVTRRSDEFFSSRLLDIFVSDIKTGDTYAVTPRFEPDTNTYSVTVPNNTDKALITVSKEDIFSTVEGDELVSLNPGRNEVNIKVTSKDLEGETNYYLAITREEAADATLKNLSVTGYRIIPSFNKMIDTYILSVGAEVEELEVIATPNDSNATVEILGNKFLTTGENEITINVTAPDNVTEKQYTIIVDKAKSTNNYLKSLSIDGYELEPVFNKTNQGPYNITVPADLVSVLVNAEAEHSGATITRDGVNTLEAGKNTLEVLVTSESGVVKTYTIFVNREKSNDSSLSDIVLTDSELNEEFAPETLYYEVELDEIDEIGITGVVNDIHATVSGNGTYRLEEGETEKLVNLVVTAEDNSTTTYIIKLKRTINASSKLKKLVLKDGEVYPKFHKLITDYTILIPYEATSLNMEYESEDPEAVTVITGNENFHIGSNQVKIKVIAKDNTSETEYIINAIRQEEASNYLKSLSVEGYTLTPEFNKNVLYYETTVGEDVETVKIKARAETEGNTVVGTGEKSVFVGDNTYYISVESGSGVVRTYQVVVKKSSSTEAKLLTLTYSPGELMGDFDPDYTGPYLINVPVKTQTVTLGGTVSTGATVVGLGDVDINLGDNNKVISVTSESGETINYDITIRRGANNNTRLTSLTPSKGELEYTNDKTSFEMNVSDDVNMIEFSAIPEDSDATVSGIELKMLDFGENTINIEVTAEDGTTKRNIEITVIRAKNITGIEASTHSLVLAINEEEEVTYTLIPNDTSYTDVIWVSDDEEIATVDDNGKVKGIKVGLTTIRVKSTHDDSIQDIVNVLVVKKQLESDIYEIVRPEVDSEEEYENENLIPVDYVIGIEPSTKVSEFKENFLNDPLTIHVYNKDNEELEDEAVIGTGMTVKLIIESVEYDSLITVVRGDVSGEGYVNVTDYNILNSYLLKQVEFSYIQKLSVDLSKDGIINITDYNILNSYLLKQLSSLND